jgi:mRNA-degrading endonuclease RelE of RelBE toxin-antitoxin system
VTYDVTLDRDAAKQLTRIHPTHAARILAAITLLADDPARPEPSSSRATPPGGSGSGTTGSSTTSTTAV